MPKIQAVTAMTLDGFLPDVADMSMRWVMNHKKGFAHWRERCDARILPHSILDLLCEKDSKDNTFTYLAEITDSESLELLRGLFLYNLVDELVIYLLPVSSGSGIPIQRIFPASQWQLHKTTVFPNSICRLIYRKSSR
ncbi:hypothetical protein [uncultured Bacteroides sp.]|uniref:hypothetical protein n=1 Tax=uncultured Bacteroides sp. TaxID=162156 RepID=UPI0025EA95EE|nr:hypothetical protein [uncultured Bacteroides sp.]